LLCDVSIGNLHWNNNFNSLASGCFWGFSEKKTPKCTWLCVGISPVWYALQTR